MYIYIVYNINIRDLIIRVMVVLLENIAPIEVVIVMMMLCFGNGLLYETNNDDKLTLLDRYISFIKWVYSNKMGN